MDASASSESTVTADLGALLESTMTLSRGLETLYSEHEVLLEALGASGETSLDSSTGRKRTRFFASWSLSSTTVESEKSWGDADVPEDFGLHVKAEKSNALSHSLNRLRAGMSEAKVRQTGGKRERERRGSIKGLGGQSVWLMNSSIFLAR
jgi:hypothetical protein